MTRVSRRRPCRTAKCNGRLQSASLASTSARALMSSSTTSFCVFRSRARSKEDADDGRSPCVASAPGPACVASSPLSSFCGSSTVAPAWSNKWMPSTLPSLTQRLSGDSSMTFRTLALARASMRIFMTEKCPDITDKWRAVQPLEATPASTAAPHRTSKRQMPLKPLAAATCSGVRPRASLAPLASALAIRRPCVMAMSPDCNASRRSLPSFNCWGRPRGAS
mmetsp:Transcript_6660/g.18548  ORF Transcript_6660/g.18548 Transcript_6660/m.18548 type:complete len:222 (+) Transcript_6660:543-1208(+)